MVKQENTRAMITLSPKTKEKIDYLLDQYDMTLTELVKWLVSEKFNERSNG